jgi:hypothetical protein
MLLLPYFPVTCNPVHDLIETNIYDKYSKGPQLLDQFAPDAVVPSLIWSRGAFIFIAPEYLSRLLVRMGLEEG